MSAEGTFYSGKDQIADVLKLGPNAGSTVTTLCRTVSAYEEGLGFLPDDSVCPECPYHYRNAQKEYQKVYQKVYYMKNKNK